MIKKEQKIELLIMQRNQLVEALSEVNAVFQKTILAFFTALSAIIVAEYFDKLEKTFVFFVVQLIVMIIMFIEALLISGNINRYYISAIDDFLREQYEVDVLFYQGKLSRKHTIEKSFFTTITFGIGVISILIFIWILWELNILNYVIECKGDWKTIFYVIIVGIETIFIFYIIIYNYCDKKRGSKIYKECMEYLKNNTNTTMINTKHGFINKLFKRW